MQHALNIAVEHAVAPETQKHINIARDIDNKLQLHTTAQKVSVLRRTYSDYDIIAATSYCTAGNKKAISEVMSKKVSGAYS